MSKIDVYPDGRLVWRGQNHKCAIGRSGVVEDKKEGDGGTPSGCFLLRKVLYRKDRIDEPKTKLPVQPINEADVWCENLEHSHYNRLSKEKHESSKEFLWREDNLYDLIVVIGYNDDPTVFGKGSAIFMHLARPNFSPTDGCVALTQESLIEILEGADKETKICINKDTESK